MREKGEGRERERESEMDKKKEIKRRCEGKARRKFFNIEEAKVERKWMTGRICHKSATYAHVRSNYCCVLLTDSGRKGQAIKKLKPSDTRTSRRKTLARQIPTHKARVADNIASPYRARMGTVKTKTQRTKGHPLCSHALGLGSWILGLESTSTVPD